MIVPRYWASFNLNFRIFSYRTRIKKKVGVKSYKPGIHYHYKYMITRTTRCTSLDYMNFFSMIRISVPGTWSVISCRIMCTRYFFFIVSHFYFSPAQPARDFYPCLATVWASRGHSSGQWRGMSSLLPRGTHAFILIARRAQRSHS